MKEIKLTSNLPIEKFEGLAMQKAVELGFNCYSKSTLYRDFDVAGGRTFFYKWKGKIVAITIIKQDENTEL